MQYGPDPNSIYPNEKIKSVVYKENKISNLPYKIMFL